MDEKPSVDLVSLGWVIDCCAGKSGFSNIGQEHFPISKTTAGGLPVCGICSSGVFISLAIPTWRTDLFTLTGLWIKLKVDWLRSLLLGCFFGRCVSTLFGLAFSFGEFFCDSGKLNPDYELFGIG